MCIRDSDKKLVGKSKTPIKKRTLELSEAPKCVLMGVEGPRHSTESKQKQHLSKKLTHKAPHGFYDDADLEALIKAWPTLPASTKAAILKLIEDSNR